MSAPVPRSRPRRSPWPNVLLALAAAIGVIAFAAVAATALFGLRVAVVETGSMTPAIPAGSAAVVRSVDAAEVRVGDVVTVARADDIPVIHRVVAIDDPGPSRGPSRELTLRGDANAVNDPEPYRVARVGLVLFAVPGAADIVVHARAPWLLGLVVLVVGGFAVVALRWQRSGQGGAEPGDVGARG